MKRMQSEVDPNQIENDMIGHQFVLSDDLLIGKTITHHYSGIDWQVKANEVVLTGTNVMIIGMEVGLLTVERVK
jgi:membrane protein implicated in regulation of membrane protease activity